MNWELVNKVRRASRVSWLKSFYLNFSRLPFKQACRLPIIVTRYTYFYSLSGNIKLEAPARFAMVRIGFQGEDVAVPKNERTLLQIEGDWILGTAVRIGVGSIIRIEPDARLIMEDGVKIGAKCRIIAYDSITIGEYTDVSWECQLLDSDMHQIVGISDGAQIAMNTPVFIGKYNWIGTRSTILKGCSTPDYTTVGALSVCNKRYEIPEYSIIAGQPADLIKTGFTRSDFYGNKKQ